MTVYYEGVICCRAGSLPSLPRLSHPPSWASDGEELSLHFPIRSDFSSITDMEMVAFPKRYLTKRENFYKRIEQVL